MTTGMENCAKPLFTFGIIADIQYADIDDGFNFKRSRKRYYRNSLRLLHNAQKRWTADTVKPRFILQLGDIIDGFNKRHDASERALETVMKEFDSSPFEVHHVWGNHEFYNFSRDTLMRSVLNSTTDSEAGGGHLSICEIYAYHFSPAPKYRFVVLDAYDVSLLGREESSLKYQQAIAILKAHNDNEDLNHPPAPVGMEQRFVKFNGGFSQDQLDWLEGVLSLADNKLERVTIVSHLPIHPSSTSPICLAWNYDALLSILQAHKSVVCFMAGHDHDGGYHRDDSGVHYLTLEGVIETPPGSDAFGTVYVYEDRMFLKGYGRMSDRILMYP
ncbi:manganese-dependent ADP-ribose/CDP-alcohol diphosphatase [Salvelinus namaycush]|uniref:Manganese-dependent ADP-ribose/CDP-alcohol diphosphatase n=1 Tax=Salvelinus namaycush TaxID=8040 RepID=A0A8U0PUM6_SALNM|nr:manganese-dependent ADP-ribose/CDP-alcohol diphosphatase [Salvelinus namaycush]